MWADEAVFYQIYPIGMCGAPRQNDGVLEHRILQVIDWIPHLKKLGITAVYFSPIFESDAHGYDTRDYRKIDCRLGTNEDFAKVVKELHQNNIKVIIDGVFNHVGRGFFGFQDVLQKREGSEYRDWFNINFGGNSPYNDGLGYEGWEGAMDLVKLNLRNPAVSDYLIESVRGWVKEFDIDGLRLDVAYMVDRDFLKRLRYETSQMKEDFFLLGEILGGDYKCIMNNEMCHSATNYECYKGSWSALASDNLFEIVHSLLRQFDTQPWSLYTGMHPVAFADNHDVTRIASILPPEKLPLEYAIVFGMPGIPMVYYGSEWGVKGDKKDGDDALRPAIEKPEWNSLTDLIAKMALAERTQPALVYGNFRSLVLENRHVLFERALAQGSGDLLSRYTAQNEGIEGAEKPAERVLVAINEDSSPYTFHADFQAGRAINLLTGEFVDFGGGLEVPAYTPMFLIPD